MLVFGVNAQGESVVKYCGFTPRVSDTAKCPVSVKMLAMLGGWRLEVGGVVPSEMPSCRSWLSPGVMWVPLSKRHSNQSAYPDFWPLPTTRHLPFVLSGYFPFTCEPPEMVSVWLLRCDCLFVLTSNWTWRSGWWSLIHSDFYSLIILQ